MSSDDAASRQDHLPLDDVPEQPTDASADTDDAFGVDPWGDDYTDPFADPASTNLFSAEIENVNASDWDIDTARIWGEDGEQGAVEDGGIGLDFPL
ncbi:MAG: hypothetical protein ABWY26_10655 [Microbacterium sp.]